MDEHRALTTIQQTDLFAETIVVDDGPLWIAWEQAKERWLETKAAKSGRTNTRKTYEVACRQFFGYCQRAPWQISNGIVQEWVAWMRSEGLAESTIGLKLAALSSLYQFVQFRYSFTTPDGREISLWPAKAASCKGVRPL